MGELSIAFGENKGLIGTICRPSAPANGANGLGMILFNAGVIHRTGPHRLNVRLARKLAEQGIPSIRFDLAGLGDSARATGDNTFEAQAVLDLRSAMDALAAATDARRFALLGLCSGAVHGYATSFADDRVVGLMMFDNYRYHTPKSRLNVYAMRVKEHGLVGAVSGWMRRRVSTAVKKAGDAGGGSDDIGFVATEPTKEEFASGLRTLLDRGMKIEFIYSGEAVELYNYEEQFQDAFKDLGVADRVTIHFLPNLDHAATSIDVQADLVLRIQRWAVDLSRSAAHSPIASKSSGVDLGSGHRA